MISNEILLEKFEGMKELFLEKNKDQDERSKARDKQNIAILKQTTKTNGSVAVLKASDVKQWEVLAKLERIQTNQEAILNKNEGVFKVIKWGIGVLIGGGVSFLVAYLLHIFK